MPESSISRRKFLVLGSTASAAALSLPSSDAATIRGGEPWAPHQADAPRPLESSHYLFFTTAEAAFVAAACERLIPADDLGPGARDAGVPLFIDHQLAGAYGRAQSSYMQGPWPKGTDTQGYQSRLAPAELYRAAIAEIDEYVRGRFDSKTFSQLGADDQDAVLKQLEGGELELERADAKLFFKTLLQNTKEGMFSDPIYGGNKDMSGWKMLGFPGARYDYLDWVDKHGQRYTLPPTGIGGRPEWHRKG